MKRIFLLTIILLILLAGCSEAEIETNQPTVSEEPIISEEITFDELSMHNTEEDCWVVYEGNVYDFTNTEMHPNMAKTFFAHCGKEAGFEEGAKGKHSKSNEDRVQNYGDFIGVLKK